MLGPITKTDSDEDEDEFHDDLLTYEIPIRHHDAPSVGSEYSPPSEDEADETHRSEDKDKQAERGSLKPYSVSPVSHRSSPLKRPFQSSTTAEPGRPFKRIRGFFNFGYLDLLNTDIQDASAWFVPHNGFDLPNLPNSRIGLTSWTTAEKAIFFEALSRLGPDDYAGIAARIGTKGELEVAQYLRLLADTATATRRQAGGLKSVMLADVPAAIELSQECCNAMEKAADALSVKQEAHEKAIEKKRWGEQNWLIAPSNHDEIEQDAPPQLKSVEIFRVGRWLELSEHVFMNSSVAEYNWMGVSDDEPAIRATALEDFYSIVASLTRRIVSASIYESESRIRAMKSSNSKVQSIVWRKDVETAVLSLGLSTNSHKFWAKAARRLKLEVLNDEDWDGSVNYKEEEVEVVSYDDVEKVLGEVGNHDMPGVGLDSETSSEDEDAGMSDASSTVTDIEDGGATSRSGDKMAKDGAQDDVQREADELFVFTALDYSKSTRTKTAVKKRIRALQAEEAYADLVDARATYHEEERLWKLLDRTPAVELATPGVSGVPPQRKRQPIDDFLCTTSVGKGGWREAVGAAAAKWEIEAHAALEGRKMNRMDDEEQD
ncbi:hypothetical protein B0T25DRAFT_454619 [Lasiosphaeria hispida]|uniref:Myb-like domain-containing protein n=1 Tax=Lasiosphaeria hispida TaxID=260671 RepID=A0AAJ0MEV0_9PEZI|nr:hypothetical protein B0T25DRAFT_454619 [Lasiosphaeria hispida]